MRLGMAFVWLLLSCGIAAAQTPGSVAPKGQPPAKVATVTVNTSSSGITIPSNFMGLSFEVGDLISGCYQNATGTWPGCGTVTSNAASFVSVVQLLGSNGVVRLGGSTSDTATPPALTQQIATNLQAFLAGIGSGWTSNVIYGLDLFANNSATAATQAGYLSTAFGAPHVTFQFSNEPLASGHFANIAAYQSAWNAYYTAVTGAVAGANYGAWDDSDLQDATTVISGLTPGLSGLSLVSYHRYSQGSTAAAIISYVPANTPFVGTNTGYLGSAISKQRLTETNSLGNGGVNGLSNTLMSAAFILNEAIQTANLGYGGINVHNRYAGQPVYYSPVSQLSDGNFGAAPIFYGMYLFAQVQGQQILASNVSGGANIVALATLRAANKANMLIVNNDQFSTSTVTPVQSAAWTTANVLKIASPAGQGCSESNPTLGGQAIGESGAWSGTTFSINNGQSITLGPCEAALVSVQ